MSGLFAAYPSSRTCSSAVTPASIGASSAMPQRSSAWEASSARLATRRATFSTLSAFLPSGICTRLELTLGDQRRVEIARALASEPRLLLLDEPAAGMNPAEVVELSALIRRIRDRGITVLLVEHHVRLIMEIADTITVLNAGSVIADGPPSVIQRDPAVISAYLGQSNEPAFGT